MRVSDPVIMGALGFSLALSAFLLSTCLCAVMRVVSPKIGLIDSPGGHKGHKKPTPLGGGVAIWLTTVIVVGIGFVVADVDGGLLPAALLKHLGGIHERARELILILALATIVMGMGLLDDRFTLGWRIRLGVQVGLALTLVLLGGLRVTLFWPFSHPIVGGAITVLWIVGLTNAFNMLDNMDGLSAGVGLVASALFAGAQLAVGSLFAPGVLLVLVGALAGFLIHNRYPARIFMGDAGSNFLGFLLGSLTVAGTYYRYNSGLSPYSVLSPLLVMAVPLYDSISVIVIRLREGRSPFLGDRRHFSHRLVDRGLTPPQAVRTIDLVTLASGLGALLLHSLDAFGACVVVGQTLCLLGVVAILEVSSPRPERVHAEAKRIADIPSETGASTEA
ncbi:MraY family glycosyltransferase [Singulisphaera sp. PoT]|uniref:MraY family glycosyltransferase n=1 Tax=Singulisphaera sp. PoT TaxID=3411797 RepID=UPI003BF5580D